MAGKRQGPDGSMSSDKSASSNQPAYPPGNDTEPDEEFRWGDVSSDILARAVDRVTENGDAISFAINRSHTTGSITILAGNERPKYYCETVGKAERTLISIANAK